MHFATGVCTKQQAGLWGPQFFSQKNKTKCEWKIKSESNGNKHQVGRSVWFYELAKWKQSFCPGSIAGTLCSFSRKQQNCVASHYCGSNQIVAWKTLAWTCTNPAGECLGICLIFDFQQQTVQLGDLCHSLDIHLCLCCAIAESTWTYSIGNSFSFSSSGMFIL